MIMNMVAEKVFKYIVISLITVSLGILTSCSNSQAPYLSMGTNFWPGYEPLYMAKEQGHLENSRIHLVEHSSASSVIKAFNNQTIDAAGVTLDEALLLQEYGHDIRIIFVMDISKGADAIMARPEFKTIASLKNKRIAVEKSALGAYVLSRALGIANMQLADINMVRTEVNHHERVYSEGKVDAVVTFEPVRTQLLKKGAIELFNSQQIPGEIVDVLVVRQDYLNKHPEVINQLIDVWFSALAYLKENPDSAYKQLSRRLNVNFEETVQMYKQLSLPDRIQNTKLLLTENANNSLLKTSLQLRDVMLKNNLLKTSVDPTLLFNNNKAVLKRFSSSEKGSKD